jgi:hypothetical protein
VPVRDLHALREMAKETLVYAMEWFDNFPLVSSPQPMDDGHEYNPDAGDLTGGPLAGRPRCVACDCLIDMPFWVCLNCEGELPSSSQPKMPYKDYFRRSDLCV